MGCSVLGFCGRVLGLDVLFRKRETKVTSVISQQFSGLRQSCFLCAFFRDNGLLLQYSSSVQVYAPTLSGRFYFQGTAARWLSLL